MRLRPSRSSCCGLRSWTYTTTYLSPVNAALGRRRAGKADRRPRSTAAQPKRGCCALRDDLLEHRVTHRLEPRLEAKQEQRRGNPVTARYESRLDAVEPVGDIQL